MQEMKKEKVRFKKRNWKVAAKYKFYKSIYICEQGWMRVFKMLRSTIYPRLPGSEWLRSRRLIQSQSAEVKGHAAGLHLGDGAGEVALPAPQHVAVDVSAGL